jgi:hypothetical protein
METMMTPTSSHETDQARARLFRRSTTTVEVSMKTGGGATQTATINVPDEALSADCFRNSLDDLIQDAFAVRMIQVWVDYCIQGKKITESLFVPVMGWHLLSVNWQIIIEDFVQEKLFDCTENQSAPPEKKRTGPALLYYRKSGKPGQPTRKELFHDWLVGLTARGTTIFYRHSVRDWSIPMPRVQPPAMRPLSEVDAPAVATDADTIGKYAPLEAGTFKLAIEQEDHKPIEAALQHADRIVGFVVYHSQEYLNLTSGSTADLGRKIQAMGFVYTVDTQENPDRCDFCPELYKTTVYLHLRPMDLK